MYFEAPSDMFDGYRYAMELTIFTTHLRFGVESGSVFVNVTADCFSVRDVRACLWRRSGSKAASAG